MQAAITKKRSGADLKFPKFEENKVSTKTIIAMTNLTLNIQNLFYYLPITDYIVVPKRRGRKKKSEKIDPNKEICSGSIITLEYEDKLRGVDLKKKVVKSEKKRGKMYFRNSVTVVMAMDKKTINFKVSRNGKFQITGCQSDEHAEQAVRYFWNIIQESTQEDDIYDFSSGECLEVLFIPAMRNIDFSLSFLVDREKLSRYINLNTPYHAMLESSFGYTGVNIKFPVKDDLSLLEIKKRVCVDDVWKEEIVSYNTYLDMLPEKEQEKKLAKERHNTFLVFHSGKCILSSMCAFWQLEPYYEFLEIIRKAYEEIEERLDVSDNE